MDWSSIGTGSPLVRTPPQSVVVRERGQEINQPTTQTTQTGSEPAQIGVTENALQEDPIVSPRTQQQPLDRLSVTNERGMIDIGTNTLDIEVRPHRDRIRTSTIEANAQTSIPIVDVMLPSSGGDHLAISQVNLSISGYEPDSLRNSHRRSPSMRAQEISIMPQLDGLASLPIRDPIGRRIQEVPRLVEQQYYQGGTYVQGAYTPRRREYPGGNGDDDDYRRLYRDQRPPERGRYPNQGGRPPNQEGYPDRGPLEEGTP